MRRLDGLAALAGFAPRAAAAKREVDRIVGILEEAGLTPPSVAELERRTGRRDVAAILRLAAAAGRVEAVERDRYYARAGAGPVRRPLCREIGPAAVDRPRPSSGTGWGSAEST